MAKQSIAHFQGVGPKSQAMLAASEIRIITKFGRFGKNMDVIEHNQEAWNRESRKGSEWCTPAAPYVIQAARQGL